MILLLDLHGCYGTMVRLLNQCAKLHPGEKLAFLGDLIDRGPNSRQVVEFAMEHKIPTCYGNHEDLALAFSAHAKRGYKARCLRYYDRDVWLWNGGEETLGNWPRFAPEGYTCGNEIPKDVLDWMQALPPYIIDPTVDDKGRTLLMSHTGYGLEADDNCWFGALWGRHPDEGPFPEDNHYRVHGHTRVHEVTVGDRWTNIDSGAAYKDYGVMTAFVWPSKAIVQQAFDETPTEARFKIVDGCVCP